MSKSIFFIIGVFLLTACSSLPTKRIVEEKYLSVQSIENENAKSIENKLSVGANNVMGGYGAQVTLITEALITAEEVERGKKNMDTELFIKSKIKNRVDVFAKNENCFLVSIDTYEIEDALFKHWRSKLKDDQGKMWELKFTNIEGVESVPSAYKDINGRDWHNNSFACMPKIDLTTGFKIFLIPQLTIPSGAERTIEFSYEIKKAAQSNK